MNDFRMMLLLLLPNAEMNDPRTTYLHCFASKERRSILFDPNFIGPSDVLHRPQPGRNDGGRGSSTRRQKRLS
jgi:hypothetical protein